MPIAVDVLHILFKHQAGAGEGMSEPEVKGGHSS